MLLLLLTWLRLVQLTRLQVLLLQPLPLSSSCCVASNTPLAACAVARGQEVILAIIQLARPSSSSSSSSSSRLRASLLQLC
jgi:hypothetical protein